MRVFEQRDLMVAETTVRVTDEAGHTFNVKAGTTVPPNLLEAYIAETGQEPESRSRRAQAEVGAEASKLQTKPERHTMQEEPERVAAEPEGVADPEREASENPITRAASKKVAARRRTSK